MCFFQTEISQDFLYCLSFSLELRSLKLYYLEILPWSPLNTSTQLRSDLDQLLNRKQCHCMSGARGPVDRLTAIPSLLSFRDLSLSARPNPEMTYSSSMIRHLSFLGSKNCPEFRILTVLKWKLRIRDSLTDGGRENVQSAQWLKRLFGRVKTVWSVWNLTFS